MDKAILSIDEEFKSLIPPLNAEERAQLEQNLLADGCREPLVVWKEERFLVDGHNRLEICQQHQIEYSVSERSFENRDAVKRWIIDNQLGRRNVTHNWRMYLMGLEYAGEKRQGARTDLTSHHFGEKSGTGTTAEKVAQKHKVGKSTVERAAKYAAGVDQVVDKFGDEYRHKILDGVLDMPSKDIGSFLKKSDLEQQGILKILDNKEAKTVALALHQFKKKVFARPAGSSDEVELSIQPALSICQPGDRWKLGLHFLGCFDATQSDSYSRLLKSNRAALIFCDPPYNAGYDHNAETILNDDLPPEEFYQLLFQSIRQMMEHCDGAFYICMGSSQIDVLKRAFDAAGGQFSDFLIWVKNQPTFGWSEFKRKYEMILYGWKQGGAHYFAPSRSETNVWEFDKPVSNKWHIAQKPVPLIMHAIELSSENRGDIILDPFAGSGSTLIACQRAGRRGYLMEKDEHRCDTIIRRFMEETQFGFMPMLGERGGKEAHISLRQICKANSDLQKWFSDGRRRFGMSE